MQKFEIKHTPGPWHPIQYAGWWELQEEPFYGEPSLFNEESCSFAKANAQLAAASPLLLSALIKAVEKDDQIAGSYNAAGYGAKYVRPYWYQDALTTIAAAGVTITQVDDTNVADLKTTQP